MVPKYSLENYRKAIKDAVGKQIILNLKRGRKMITVNDCIIENAYQGIFVVKIIGESLIATNRISVSYADLLTGNARVSIKNNAKLA